MISELIKINFLQSFSSMKMRTNKRSIWVFAIMFLVVGFCMGSQFYMMAGMFVDKTGLFMMGGISAFFFIMFALVLQSQNYFFKNKDYELLATLPLKSFDIVVSKSISALLISYIYQSIILIPVLVVYFITAGFSFYILFMFVLGYLLFPLFPLALSFLISLVINLILSKTRYKNIVNYALMILLFVGFFLTFAVLGDILTQNIEIFQLAFPTVGFFYNAIAGNFVNILYLLLLGAGSIALALYLVSLGYKKVNQGSITGMQKKQKLNLSSVSFSYFKFEAKRYFSLPIYVFNTIVGPVLLLAVPFIKFIPGFPAESMFYASIMSFVLALSVTTNVSISLEGTRIELLKSLPLNPMRLYINKILFNLALTVPAILVCSTLIVSLNSFAWYESLFMFLLPLIATLAFTTLGLLVNLYFPKFNYTSVAQVVKQSMSVFISLFAGMIVSLVASSMLPFIGLPNSISLMIYCTILLAIFVTCAIMLIVRGRKKWMQLQV